MRRNEETMSNLAAPGLYDFDGEPWQIDMIQIRKGSRFDGFSEQVAERIKSVLTPETRAAILKLKYLTPDDEHIPGIAYYRTVIADGVRTYREFSAWRQAHPADGINLWVSVTTKSLTWVLT